MATTRILEHDANLELFGAMFRISIGSGELCASSSTFIPYFRPSDNKSLADNNNVLSHFIGSLFLTSFLAVIANLP